MIDTTCYQFSVRCHWHGYKEFINLFIVVITVLSATPKRLIKRIHRPILTIGQWLEKETSGRDSRERKNTFENIPRK